MKTCALICDLIAHTVHPNLMMSHPRWPLVARARMSPVALPPVAAAWQGPMALQNTLHCLRHLLQGLCLGSMGCR